MAVHPIEKRYSTAEMRAVGDKQNRFSCIIKAGVTLTHAEAVCEMIPPTTTATSSIWRWPGRYSAYGK